MLVDSGADGNLVTATAWNMLKQQHVIVISSMKGASRILRGYGSDKSLTILGSFTAENTVGAKSVEAEFLVVEEGQQPSSLVCCR